MHAPGIWGILVVAVVVILLFGRGKISGMMGEVASGIKAFQKGMKDDETTPTERVTTTTAKVDASEVDRSKDA
ncbi:preprotein translocase subunit TatA [Devosia epidermidihirudinis]|uniref:Sec-independent protein translocase protein TatA n=1 Tax=Devosia epidermidihirudinis TaxID=1293439 RepID=A0A0F5QEP5_9HYPH|nr:twin-arginine translocase TatA/TatE family subunit [Devosia epidermidihirudinis]KKC39467.1 preprotein translocase subunit TatA [Devosia epidermidihirudinis]